MADNHDRNQIIKEHFGEQVSQGLRELEQFKDNPRRFSAFFKDNENILTQAFKENPDVLGEAFVRYGEVFKEAPELLGALFAKNPDILARFFDEFKEFVGDPQFMMLLAADHPTILLAFQQKELVDKGLVDQAISEAAYTKLGHGAEAVAEFNHWRNAMREYMIASGGSDIQLDLSDKSFEGLQLPGVDLSSANLSRASFKKVNLTGANLTDADLDATILGEATLDGVRVSPGELEKAVFGEVSTDNTPQNSLQKITDDEMDNLLAGVNPKTTLKKTQAIEPVNNLSKITQIIEAASVPNVNKKTGAYKWTTTKNNIFDPKDIIENTDTTKTNVETQMTRSATAGSELPSK